MKRLRKELETYMILYLQSKPNTYEKQRWESDINMIIKAINTLKETEPIWKRLF